MQYQLKVVEKYDNLNFLNCELLFVCLIAGHRGYELYEMTEYGKKPVIRGFLHTGSWPGMVKWGQEFGEQLCMQSVIRRGSG